MLLKRKDIIEHILKTEPYLIAETCKKEGNTALHIAIKERYFEGINLLMAVDKEVLKSLLNCQNKEKMTPLFLAFQNYNKNLVLNIFQQHQEILSYDVKDKEDKTALHYAVEYNQLDAVKVLLSVEGFSKSLVNSQATCEKTTPLMLAIRKDNRDMIEEILNFNGLEFSLKNAKDQNVLHLLMMKKNIEHSESVLKMACRNGSNQCLSCQMDKEQKKLPLHYAAEYDFFEGAKLLLIQDNHPAKSCCNDQIDQAFAKLQMKENEFLASPLFKILLENWTCVEKSLAWYATKHSKLSILDYLLKDKYSILIHAKNV